MSHQDKFEILSELNRNSYSITYRAMDKKDFRSLVVLELLAPSTAFMDWGRFAYQMRQLIELSLPHVVPYIHFERFQRGAERGGRLYREELEGVSLKNLLKEKVLPLDRFFALALQLVEGLEELHGAKILHGEIRPSSILVKGEEVFFTHLGFFSAITGHQKDLYGEETVGELIPYLSPERTPWFHRNEGEESDLYSLGVLFYEMLSGKKPFLASDPLETIESHLCGVPLDLRQWNRDIPASLAAVIDRLMEKEPEERYRRASDLKKDLQECGKKWLEGDREEVLEAGECHVPLLFSLSQKIYGRDRELEEIGNVLNEAIEKSSPLLLLLHGEKGVGKFRLARELAGRALRMRCYFVEVCCRPKEPPYGPLLRAFEALFEEVLREKGVKGARWKKDFLRTLDKRAGFLNTLFPPLEEIIGPCLPPDPFPRGAAFKKELAAALGAVMPLLARKEHPLLFLFKDFCRADRATELIMEELFSHKGAGSFWVIATSSEKEANLRDLVEGVRLGGAMALTLPVTPLSKKEIEGFAAATLRCEMEEAHSLATFLERKSRGLPHKMKELFIEIKEKGGFEEIKGKGWYFREEVEIEEDYWQKRVQRKTDSLSEGAREAVKMAASLGFSFDPSLLAALCHKTGEELYSFLVEARDLELMEIDRRYAFSSREIYEAILDAMSGKERRERERIIGKRLTEQNAIRAPSNEKLFQTLDFLNGGGGEFFSREEKMEVAELNYQAGMRAKEVAGYEQAARYFQEALEITPSIPYPFLLKLLKEAMESEALAGRLEESDRYALTLLEKSDHPFHRLQAYRRLVKNRTSACQWERAWKWGVEAMTELGFSFKDEEGEEERQKEERALKDLLEERRMEELLYLLPASDDEKKALLDLFPLLLYPLIRLQSPLLTMVTVKSLRLSYLWGRGEGSSYICALYALLNGPMKSFAWGKLALAMSTQKGEEKWESAVNAIYGIFVNPRRYPLGSSIPYLKKAIHYGRERGEPLWSGYARSAMGILLFFRGSPLKKLRENLSREFVFLKRDGHVTLPLMRDLILCLEVILGEKREKELTQKPSQGEEDPLCPFSLWQGIRTMLLSLLSGEELHPSAGTKVLSGSSAETGGIFFLPYSLFFRALILSSPSPGKVGREEKKELEEIKNSLERWGEESSQNYGSLSLLVQGQWAKLQDRSMEAMKLYDRALKKEPGAPLEWALGNELAGKFWVGKQKEDFAAIYLSRARRWFHRWGAASKVFQMDKGYPFLPREPSREEGGEGEVVPADLVRISGRVLGVLALEKLLPRILETAIENSRAGRGALILNRRGKLFLEAEMEKGKEARFYHSVPYPPPKGGRALIPLSPSVIQSVKKGGREVVGGESAEEEHQGLPASYIAVPLLKQRQLMGILWLENRDKTGAFSPSSVDLLKLIASQAAIAIDNAFLYSQRLRSEEEREKLELRLLTAQKMESVGRLAGGIAHDFNNILSAINGYAQLTLMDLEEGSPLRENVEVIYNAGRRGANLTKQLLAFSKGQVVKTGIIDLNEVIRSMEQIIDRVIGENVEIKLCLTQSLWPVKVNRSQIEQVVMNLVVNARDAMPRGGRIDLETDNFIFGEKEAEKFPELLPGEYVLLSVKDRGQGIPDSIKVRIFEPFFSTKEEGKGTGLGLATVYGIVKQNKGFIFLNNREGGGTLFHIFLPRCRETGREEKESVKEVILKGKELVLLVEDDDYVRELLFSMLVKLGYEVIAHSDGKKALEYCLSHKGSIDLLLTDVVMPGLSGGEVAQEARKIFPSLKVLFISGYLDKFREHPIFKEKGLEVIEKPVDIHALSKAVRQALQRIP